jgi:HAD superfamily hydrolase (TIGR01549 family)
MIRAVIFDIDGTLIDSVDGHAQAWIDAFREFGKDVAFEDVRSQIGKGGDQLLPVFLTQDEIDQFGKALEDWRGEHLKRHFLPKFHGFPCVRELFERVLADGKRIALASSAKADELKRYKEIAGIADLIDDGDTTSSSDAERSKPHPDIFQAALSKLGLDPHEAIVVGDTPYDALAAGKAGLPTIGVLCGGFPERSLLDAGCLALFRDPADLLANYDSSPLAG